MSDLVVRIATRAKSGTATRAGSWGIVMDSRLPDRFWDKIEPEPNSGCWLWIGALRTNGYGTLRATPRSLAKQAACIHGHSFDDANTYRNRNGNRWCRACDREKHRRQRERR